MPSIFNVVSFHSGLHDGFRNVHTMVLEEPALGSGSFGDVYVCTSINGASPPLPQAVKILHDDGTDKHQRGFETIQKLQQQIRETNVRRAAAGQPGLESMPALRALPQFSFLGEMDGREVLGYSATLLDTKDYIPFDKIVGMQAQPELLECFFTLSTDERIILAAEMTEGGKALTEMSFIHADINAPNLLIDIEHCHLAIIDYDSGAVMDDRPTTFGKRDLWLAPELHERMAQQDTAEADTFTDRWSVFIGIHHLLFLGHPLFFFNDYISRQSVSAYLDRYRWPHITTDDPLFNPNIGSAYEDYLFALTDLPTPLQKELSTTMNDGFLDPAMRTSYQQWASVLRAAIRGPEIAEFSADWPSIFAGMSTRLSWSVSGAYKVFLDHGIGEVDPNGQVEVSPTETRIYTLTALTRQGESVTKCLTVRLWPLPELRAISVPSCNVDLRVSLRALGTMPQIHLPVTVDLGVNVVEPSAQAAQAGFEAAQERTPKRFPGLRPRVGRMIAVFNQLKSQFDELIGDVR
jgi:serine/threonine protein kinase